MNKVRAGYKMTELGEIPIEWEVKRLEECTNKITDGSHTSPAPVEISNYKICTVANMKKYKLDLENSTNISEEDYIRLIKNGCSAERGDVLLSKDGTVGKTLVYSQSGENIVFLSSIAIIRPQKNILLGEYLNQYLQETKTLERLSNTKTGSAIKRIVLKDIKNIKIIIPKIQEQERIASILSTVDEQIDNVDALIEKNKELKKGLMQTLLTKGIGHTKFKKTEIGEIPEEWQNESLGDMVNFEGGTQPPKKYFSNECLDGMIRLIQIRDYKSDKFKVYVPKELCRRFCDKSDVMIGRYGPPIFQILRGLEGAYNVALIKATPINERLDREYLYYFLNNEKLFNLIDSLSQRTSGQTGIDMEVLKAYKIPIPPKKEQEKIVLTLSQIDKRIENYENRNKKLEELKKGLMQQLLTGKIRTI